MLKIEKLLSTLRLIEADSNLPTPLDPELVNLTEENEKVRTAVVAAEAALITEEGRPNWDTIKILRDAGYPVFQGESDEFGWLSGCILTRKGIIVFG